MLASRSPRALFALLPRPARPPLALVPVAFVAFLSAACSASSGETTAGAGGQDTGTQSGSGAGGAMAGSNAAASGTGGAGTSGSGSSGSSTSGSSTSGSGGGSPCPPGVTCVDSFPFHDDRDTSIEGSMQFDTYPCKATADESGPEIVYRVTLPEAGFLSAAVYSSAGNDMDVHILSSFDSTTCLDRGDLHARADVPAGYAWVVVDTYVSGGVPQSGPFGVDIGFIAPSQGPCDMEMGFMPRVGDGGNSLPMPATGPMVLEAHLVTQEEPPPYPSTSTEELAAHYALSQAKTGLVMYRNQVWAPLEGGSFYGAGIGSPTDFPTLHEGWYVNMYWTSAARPPKGTRMIVREPGGSRAVVVAAGYETGPGNLAHIGGTPEETHFYMRTGHLDTMTLGIAVDQNLPYGPRNCQ